MNWAIEMIALCTVALGCVTGQRDENAAAQWILTETKAQCEAQNEARTREIVEGAGDTVVQIAVQCSQVGV